MKTTILHDEKGKIIAISKEVSSDMLKEARSRCTKFGMGQGKGQKLIEVELSPEDEKRPLRELHTIYRVDVATSKLVKL